MSRVTAFLQKGIREMRVSHAAAEVSVRFDDPNLVSCAGLAPTLLLAQRCGLHDLVAEHGHVEAAGGANAQLKVPAIVAGMVAGADSIEDLDLLRHGGMDRLVTGVRAPSTLGTFLRAMTSATSASSTRSPPGSCRRWRRTPRCCPAPTR